MKRLLIWAGILSVLFVCFFVTTIFIGNAGNAAFDRQMELQQQSEMFEADEIAIRKKLLDERMNRAADY